MKVLFCHDGPLYKDDDYNYYGVSFTDDIFKRYYHIAEELTVAMRVKDIGDSKAREQFSQITVTPFKVLEIPNLSSLKGQVYKKRNAKKLLYQYIQDSDFIVVRLPSTVGNLAATIARELKKPYLVELVGDPWDALWNHSTLGKIVAPSMRYRTKKSVRNASHVVYVTNGYLQKRYPTNGKNISCSNVSLEKLNANILLKRLAKIKNNKTSNKVILGTTAAIDVKYKGQQYVIEALGELKKRGINNIEYQLVGRGNPEFLESCAINNNVQDQVKFLGLLPHSEVFDWLDSIDLYIQPSLTEGLPRGLIESMSRGLPALGAKSGGIPELLDDKVVFNNRTNIIEITKLLSDLNKEELLNQAKVNFEKSKEYQKHILNNKRAEFFEVFKRDSLNK